MCCSPVSTISWYLIQSEYLCRACLSVTVSSTVPPVSFNRSPLWLDGSGLLWAPAQGWECILHSFFVLFCFYWRQQLWSITTGVSWSCVWLATDHFFCLQSTDPDRQLATSSSYSNSHLTSIILMQHLGCQAFNSETLLARLAKIQSYNLYLSLCSFIRAQRASEKMFSLYSDNCGLCHLTRPQEASTCGIQTDVSINKSDYFTWTQWARPSCSRQVLCPLTKNKKKCFLCALYIKRL